MRRTRPTAAGLAASLGIAPAEPAAVAPPATPVEAEPVVPAVPTVTEPVAPVAPARRPGRMTGIVPPIPIATETEAETASAPVVDTVRRTPPTTPRPVLLRLAGGEKHPIPAEWRDEFGRPYEGWYLTYAEERTLVALAPPGAMMPDEWPGCPCQYDINRIASYDPASPYDVWLEALSRRRKLWEAANGPISDRMR